MARQIINIGTQPNDRSGDPLRVAFTKTNSNFAELYSTVVLSKNIDGGSASSVYTLTSLNINGGNASTVF